MNPVTKQFQFGEQKVTLETGRIAKQATGAVLVTMGNTVVLCTAVGMKQAKAGQAFFPLTVNYQEKTYAAGKIPGGFFRREGRPSEKETLTSRLIDRPIRPLFPKGFMNEVQVICTVMSADKNEDPDIASLIGASAALAVSGIPFDGPIGAARVGYKDGEYLLNPSYAHLLESSLSMVVAGTDEAVLMVESEAEELTEDQMLGAVLFAHQEMQIAINAIKELAAEAGKPRWDWQPPPTDEELKSAVEAAVKADLGEAYRITDKMERQARVSEIRNGVIERLAGGDNPQFDAEDVAGAFGKIEKNIVRQRVLNGEPRIDGRDLRTVRPIDIQVPFLPKTHGSALFTRGETQAIVVATLGTLRDAALIDALEGSYKDNFLLHYNFPPFSVGEAGRFGFTSRREIGHGALAERSVLPVLPPEDDFPYAIRLVSEVMSSNGSTSMASVCGGSLALMDAGVPLSQHVAGISTGLVTEMDNDGNIAKYVILTDIIGAEDHFGDMDFKVCGTRDGVTGFQLDLKIQGLPFSIAKEAVKQVTEARMKILDVMDAGLPSHRKELREHAPRIEMVQIDPEKIGALIGPGGKNIRRITEVTGANIDIDEDNSGKVRIYATDTQAMERALQEIDLVK